MPIIWDLREVFDLYPDEPGFICSGITKKGARCRQSFIARVDKVAASRLLDSLPEQDGFFTNPRAIYSSLQQLAELTLCPRWHRHGHLSQIDSVASKWLRIIQGLNTGRSGQRRAPQPQASLLSNYQQASVPNRTLLPDPASYHHSRSSSIATVSSRPNSNRSQTPSVAATPPRTPRRSPTSPIDGGVGTSAIQTPNTTQITVSVTVSSSNGREQNSTTVVHQLPTDSPPSNSTITISTGSPQTIVNLSTSPQNSRANEPISNSSPSIHARQRLQQTSRALTPVLDSTYLGSPNPGTLSRITSSGPSVSRVSTLYLSPPPSPLPNHPAGTLSISTDSGRDTPLSLEAVSDYAISPPGTPILSSTQISRSPSPSSSISPHDPAPSVTSLARQRPTRVARRPITAPCYVSLLGIEARADAVWCQESCGQNAHTQCFEKWAETCNASGRSVTCMFCRAPWVS